MTDYEKLKLRELHLIASAMVELVSCTGRADDYNLNGMTYEYNALDDYVTEMCRLEGEKPKEGKADGQV